jgi:hypothetical protein
VAVRYFVIFNLRGKALWQIRKVTSGSQKVAYTERREDGSLFPLLTQKLGHCMEQKDDGKYPLLVQRPGYWNMELIGNVDRILLQVGIKPENKKVHGSRHDHLG